METIEITPDFKVSKEVYRKYFQFYQKKPLTSNLIITLVSLGLASLLIGLTWNIGFWLFIALIFLGIATVTVLWHLIKLRIASITLYKSIDPKVFNQNSFHFSFDEKEIIIESTDALLKVKWDSITHYEENNLDLYLYYKNDVLYDIISPSIMGDEYYQKFISVIENIPHLKKIKS